MDELRTASAGGHELLVVVGHSACDACPAIHVEMQRAAAQLPSGALKLGSVDVSTAAGAELSRVLLGADAQSTSPVLLIISSSHVWEYRGAHRSAALVATLRRWQRERSHEAQGSEVRLVRRLPPAHLQGGVALPEPFDSPVATLGPHNLTAVLGDGSTSRPHAKLALVLLYGSEHLWAPSTRQTHRAFRAAATALHARGLHVKVAKACLASDDADDASFASAEDARRHDLTGPEWHVVLRAVVSTGDAAGRLLAAVQHSLPRVLLLREGQLDLWASPVSSHDLVDVVSQLAHPVLSHELMLLDAANFSAVSAKVPVMLATFTTRWCARCVEQINQLQRAALLLRRMQPAMPVTLALFDMSIPTNVQWLSQTGQGLASFPVGIVYYFGVPFRPYTRGPSAPEIVQEMMRLAEELREHEHKRVSSAQESGMYP